MEERLKPYYENENGRLYHGDNIELFKMLDDNSIDLTVTSPPYDNLRAYNGYNFNFHKTAKELYRVTKKGGVVVWVVGDATVNGSESGTSFKQALYFMYCGFKLHDTMIYASEKPPLTHNRYEQKFEYMFIFSKGKPKTFNPIKEKTTFYGSSSDRPETKKGSRKDGAAVRSKKATGKKINEFKIIGNIWKYKTGGGLTTKDKIAFKHPAIFPEQLARDHIISWSNKKDIILDPFSGSGTTAKISESENRQWIAFEISKEYCNIVIDRIESENRQLKLF